VVSAGWRAFGVANGLRRAIEQGRVVLEDFSNLAMALRLLGGALNWPFVPATVNIGSDLQYRRAFEPNVHPNPKQDTFGDGSLSRVGSSALSRRCGPIWRQST
jgi:hypothetical protein